MKIRKALISVSDKTDLIPFAKKLSKHKVEMLSTGGTAKQLRENNIEITDVSKYTNFPEMMDGRVKTLHPLIHGGILALRDNDNHIDAIKNNSINLIDLVVINLYPFEKTVQNKMPFKDCIENIDIGGPALIRSASKNYQFVCIITDIDDYDKLIEELEINDGKTTEDFRKKMAIKAFKKTYEYDYEIFKWLQSSEEKEDFPDLLNLKLQKKTTLRYGENPHQQAAIYLDKPNSKSIFSSRQIHGKPLSYNNINDTEAAVEITHDLEYFKKPTIVIIKHANPCGVAVNDVLSNAFNNALNCDPISAFGSIISSNRVIDLDTAKEIDKLFVEVLIAPGFNNEALKVLTKKQNMRLLENKSLINLDYSKYNLKSIAGGFLVQTRDTIGVTPENLKIVSKIKPSEQEIIDMLFAFKVAKHVKSNAIVYAKNLATVGIGAGQMSRLDSAHIAAHKSKIISEKLLLEKSLTENSVAASDAFFPFPDGLETIIQAGAKAVIQPGGSLRDQDVIDTADIKKISMIFTGIRHFKH